MSRTDVHRPIHVQAKDPTIRHWFKDIHNHEKGFCDLDEYLNDGWHTGACYRLPWRSPNLCGCHLCTGQPWNRAERRHNRHDWRHARRNLLTYRREDRPEMDYTPHPYRS